MFFLHDLFTSSTTSQIIKSMDKHEDICEESKTLINLKVLQAQNTSLLAEIQLLNQKNDNFECKQRELEEKIVNLRLELDDAQKRSVVEELIQRDFLKSEISAVEERVSEKEAELARKFGGGLRGKDGFLEEFEGFKAGFSRGFEVLGLIKECLIRVCVGLGVNKFGNFEDELDFDRKSDNERLLEDLNFVLSMSKRVEEKLCDNQLMSNVSKVVGLVNESLMRIIEGFEGEDDGYGGELSSSDDDLELVARMVKRVERKVSEYQEKMKKEKRELEHSVLSLTEENRDINALLRIALVEKEALEKSMMKLKGGSNEQKRMPLLQFAGKSLQSIGFGFIMGGGAEDEMEKDDADQCSDNTAPDSAVVSDCSGECEEQVVNLASAVENLVKKLRLEITHLRKSLDESRLDSEHLRSLTEKQAQQIIEQTVHIKDLEERKSTLTRNVEELLTEIKTAEEDVERWRAACELEVEAGKCVINERDKVVAILTRELEKTRAALQVSNKKIKMKEELVQAAMAAQLAAEKSVQLADSRAIVFRERIEALTRQLEESLDSRDKNSKIKLSRLCWPFQVFKLATPANNTNSPRVQHSIVRQMPEMQALFQSV